MKGGAHQSPFTVSALTQTIPRLYQVLWQLSYQTCSGSHQNHSCISSVIPCVKRYNGHEVYLPTTWITCGSFSHLIHYALHFTVSIKLLSPIEVTRLFFAPIRSFSEVFNYSRRGMSLPSFSTAPRLPRPDHPPPPWRRRRMETQHRKSVME